MASLSLPRVLQLKKNSLDAEREQFEKFQTLAIQKAINSIETPVKEKHVRSTIIGTFQEQSAITYWMVAIRLPLQDNRIVAWKFCHVTHKLLREGHPACLDDSQRHIAMIENLGKLWVHLREGYGRLVHLYTGLLVCKLKFHARNPRFPGNMQLTSDELDNIAENDVNNYFQLCVELFDYLDDILNLQAAVFDSLGNARANSMTASGQCRLAALIPCAQDSSQIYDCNVRLLFRLHASLPADTLLGHRERFRQQFKKLSSFYKHASSLQYYRNLLTLPVLPSNPPNFLQQSDFGTYVTPVVSIPEPAPDEVDSVGSLIDTSDTMSQVTSPDNHVEDFERPSPSPQPDPVVERDRLIEHLQNELKRMRSEVSQLVQERNTMLGSMREHCARLETQLHSAQSELEEEKQKVEVLAVQTPEIKQKLTETEEKAKVQDEKFQKLKGAYTQLREEHIALIRQKAEVDKLSASLRAAAAQHESAKVQLQQQLDDRLKDVELLQQSASSSEEIEAYQNQIANLRSDLDQSRQKEIELNTVKAALEALEIEHKTAKTEQEDKINMISSELKDATETLERTKQEKEEKETELTRVKEELLGLREKSGDEYKKVAEEKEAALKEVAELKQQFQMEKQELTQQTRETIDELQAKNDELQLKLTEARNTFSYEVERFNMDFMYAQDRYKETKTKKDEEIKEAAEKTILLERELESTKASYEASLLEKSAAIENLQSNLDELVEYKMANEIIVSKLTTERDNALTKFAKVTDSRDSLEKELQDRISELCDLSNQLHETEMSKTEEIKQLEEQLIATEEKSRSEISVLKLMLDEKSQYGDEQKSQSENLYQEISKLNATINEKDKEIRESNAKISAITTDLEKLKVEYENHKKDTKYEITILQDKLHNVTESKDEIINNLKSMISEKDSQVISLSVESTKHSEEVLRLTDLLEESQAELEIGKNELFTLKEEHDRIVQRNETNLSMKNEELRNLHDEVKELKEAKIELENERDKNNNENIAEKQVLEEKIIKLDDEIRIVMEEYNTLKEELTNIKNDYEHTIESKDSTIHKLTEKEQRLDENYKTEIAAKDESIRKVETEFALLKTELEELQKVQAKEKEDVETMMLEKDKEKQILEARLEHTEEKRLNAECELQDLLQHNSVLEADLAAARIQLEEARKKVEEQSSRLVSCASDAAVEVTNEALAALERSNAQESNKAAAELALKALEQLARCTEVKGNEESIAKSAICVAHNTAQLSAYVTEVSHISTDMELADKLNTECRTMLTATKECLDSLRRGELASTSLDTRGKVRAMIHAATAADAAQAGPRSVDDELGDLDTAIEEAASQIESMLANSRASDSGIQLEVNEKILDACTTLMAAVKILVQDARRLQHELGDTSTRHKMYRKNPQWSEGLISAAKAVVFAAKLLVTSADEAVGAAGRVEGVSAAAHEVAGSTAQLVAASRARAPPAAPSLARLTHASRSVAAATGAVVAAVRAASARRNDQEALDTSALTLTATRRLEMESKVRSLELESALDAERARLAALRKRHYQLAQLEENGNVTNGKE